MKFNFMFRTAYLPEVFISSSSAPRDLLYPVPKDTATRTGRVPKGSLRMQTLSIRL